MMDLGNFLIYERSKTHLTCLPAMGTTGLAVHGTLRCNGLYSENIIMLNFLSAGLVVTDSPTSHSSIWPCFEVAGRSERENVVAWGKALQQAATSSKAAKEQHALGLVDTEWGQDLPVEHWGNIPNVSACAWNVNSFVKSAGGDF